MLGDVSNTLIVLGTFGAFALGVIIALVAMTYWLMGISYKVGAAELRQDILTEDVKELKIDQKAAWNFQIRGSDREAVERKYITKHSPRHIIDENARKMFEPML